MARYIESNIYFGNLQIDTFSDLYIFQSIDKHHTFEIILPLREIEGSTKNKISKSKDLLGKKIEIQFSNNCFYGLITEINSVEHNQSPMLRVSGQGITMMLEDGSYCRSFTNKSLKQIFKDVLDPYQRNLNLKIETEINPKFGDLIPFCVQYRESNYNFLNRIAARYGEWFYFNGKELLLEKPNLDKIFKLIMGIDVNDFGISLNITPLNFKLFSYNYQENKLYESQSTNASVSGLDEYGKAALNKSEEVFRQETSYPAFEIIEEKDDLDKLVQYKKSASVNNMVIARGVSEIPDLTIGSIIEVFTKKEDKSEELYGQFIITEISHSMQKNGNYQNNFEAIPSSITSAPIIATIKQPICEAQTAFVEENNDPDKLGRVKVKFHWQKSPEKTPWIRLLSSHSGEDRGYYFIPEIGDEVLVGFEENNPDKPFVMGSLYHGKVAPKKWHDADNLIKVIKTKGGNEIYFNDGAGKEEIKIINKDAQNEISLSLEEEGKITIKTKGKLEISAKSIRIESEEGLSIKSGRSTQIKAQELKIESSQASLKSSSQLDIDGGASASIKAGIIKLN